MIGSDHDKLIVTHDSFFKGAFSYPDVAASYLRNFLPADLSSKLDLTKLQLSSNSYVTNDLRPYFSDLVWLCPFEQSEIQVAFLFEHKSYPVRFPHLQLLRYMLQIWEVQLEDKATKQLKPVIPILFYHGLKKWKLNPFYSYFGGVGMDLLRFIPGFEYILTDIGRESETKIANLDTEKLVMTLLSFQQYRDTRKLIENMELVLEKIESFELSQENENFVKMVLVYILNHSKLNPQEMEELITSSRSKSIRKSRSTAQQLIEQGLQKGVEQGIEQGIEISIIRAHEKGKSLSLLVDIFDKTAAEIQKIITRHLEGPK